MSKEQSLYLKIGIGAAAALALYWFLKKQGYWDQWFSSNTFTDPAKLMAYCQANPDGQATLVDQSGNHTASCAEWIRVNQLPAMDSSGAESGLGQTAGTDSSIDQALLQRLKSAAQSNFMIAGDAANVDQWNGLLQELDPNARVTDLSEAGIRRDQVMNAQGYLLARVKAGLTALAPAPQFVEHPYSWGGVDTGEMPIQ